MVACQAMAISPETMPHQSEHGDALSPGRIVAEEIGLIKADPPAEAAKGISWGQGGGGEH